MIDPETVKQTIAQYEKHGWKLRRALLSPTGKTAFADLTARVPVEDSDFEALWFSRKSKPESEAWELRRLSGSPFALVAVVSASATNDEIESTLAQVVDEMREKTIA